MNSRALCLCVLVLAGCPREAFVLSGDIPACPADAPEIGQAGGFAVDRFELEWVDFHKPSNVATAAPIHVRIPDDIVSYAVTVDAADRYTALGAARVEDRFVLDINGIEATGLDVAPFFHTWSITSTLVQPVTTDTAPTPGCLTLVALSDGDATGEGATLSIASRRGDVGGVLDINVVTVAGLELAQPDLDDALQHMITVLDGSGIQAGDLAFVEVDGEPFIEYEDEEALSLLRATDVGGPERALNLFIVQDFTEADGTLGFAAGIPGPIALPGTAGSGVVMSVDAHLDGDFAFDPILFGETAGHEVAHQLGLFHTSESDGLSHDPLPDTPECTADAHDADGDKEVTAEECDGQGGRNVMFWVSGEFSQDVWSADQSFVLSSSPTLR